VTVLSRTARPAGSPVPRLVPARPGAVRRTTTVAEVRSPLVGVQGCTNLNDPIGFLRYVEPMTGHFGGVHPQPANPTKEIPT